MGIFRRHQRIAETQRLESHRIDGVYNMEQYLTPYASLPDWENDNWSWILFANIALLNSSNEIPAEQLMTAEDSPKTFPAT